MEGGTDFVNFVGKVSNKIRIVDPPLPKADFRLFFKGGIDTVGKASNKTQIVDPPLPKADLTFIFEVELGLLDKIGIPTEREKKFVGTVGRVKGETN